MGIGEASLYHALIVIFLEFFSWGLLTVPIINVLASTFPDNKFLMNGLVMGVKVRGHFFRYGTVVIRVNFFDLRVPKYLFGCSKMVHMHMSSICRHFQH